MSIYLHDHESFHDLISIIEAETGINSVLVEKDYWIMHCLYGLQLQGYDFQLKGGTSLSKGYGLIHRFSEDIDIHISPPNQLNINQNPKNSSKKNIQKKKEYYDQLASELNIPGIKKIERDEAFDDVRKYNNGGIRLFYNQSSQPVEGIKEGILLEVGYDNVVPNRPILISSWAFEKARNTPGITLIDNRAHNIQCYDFRYTFVEKIQTIVTKFRNEISNGKLTTNYMRQYYDLYCLIDHPEVIDFIGSDEYEKHKQKRFPVEDYKVPLNKCEAFLLKNTQLRKQFRERYEKTKSLYYKGQPIFEEILEKLQSQLDKL